jgi:hypothetical protein
MKTSESQAGRPALVALGVVDGHHHEHEAIEQAGQGPHLRGLLPFHFPGVNVPLQPDDHERHGGAPGTSAEET